MGPVGSGAPRGKDLFTVFHAGPFPAGPIAAPPGEGALLFPSGMELPLGIAWGSTWGCLLESWP